MQKDQFNQQPQKIDSLYRSTVVTVHCIIGNENYPDAGTKRNCAVFLFSLLNGIIVSCFRHLGKGNFSQLFIPQEIFITSYHYLQYMPGYNL